MAGSDRYNLYLLYLAGSRAVPAAAYQGGAMLGQTRVFISAPHPVRPVPDFSAEVRRSCGLRKRGAPPSPKRNRLTIFG